MEKRKTTEPVDLKKVESKQKVDTNKKEEKDKEKNKDSDKDKDKEKDKEIPEEIIIPVSKNILAYKPFSENDVLTVCCTQKTVLMLLRNGTVFSWGELCGTLGRKLSDSTVDTFIPMPIKFPTNIVDLACGINHCLARGVNFKVYSWGNNSHGQVKYFFSHTFKN